MKPVADSAYQPLVTIVTPSYNQAAFIRATIDSVLAQDYPNIEYLIVDGGSKDGTLDILAEYGNRIRWISEKDKGQSDAINKGFRMASGEIVAWLNSDDTYEPRAVTAAVAAFAEDPSGIALVYGDGWIIDEQGMKVMRFGATQDFDLWMLTSVWDYIMQPTTFFRADALADAGYLDVALNWCMDWDLWIRLGLKHGVRRVDAHLANSREYGETKTSTGGWKRLREIQSIYERYAGTRRPPGYWLYAADTLVKVFEGNRILKRAMQILSGRVAAHVFGRLPIRYADGWLGRRYRFVAEASVREIILRFAEVLPNELMMRVSVDDKPVGTAQPLIPNGTISIVLEPGTNHQVLIEASRVVRAGVNDPRRLSARLSSEVRISAAGADVGTNHGIRAATGGLDAADT